MSLLKNLQLKYKFLIPVLLSVAIIVVFIVQNRLTSKFVKNELVSVYHDELMVNSSSQNILYSVNKLNNYIVKISINKKFNKKIVTYVRKFDKFYKAEDKHQNYYEEKFLNYLRYKKVCGREKTLNKIWN